MPPKPPLKAHIEIEGTWTNSDFAETDVIDDTTWSSAFGDADPNVSDIVEFSNSERYVIRSSPDFNDPDKTVYDRSVWKKPAGGVFYYCTYIFGCETPELTATGDGDGALVNMYPSCDLTPYDASDPTAADSCGGFAAWTKLTAE